MTAVDVEPDTIAHLDWQPPCELENCTADHPPATHHVRWDLPCPCGPTRLICTPCVERHHAWIRDVPNPVTITCRLCGATVRARLADVIIIRPLDVR